MEAIGMIETRGLLPAIESADAMLKAAEVKLLERCFVGGGLVTITVTGDVAAVKASVDAAAAAVARLGTEMLISQHVIPRPHQELGECIVSPVPLAELTQEKPKAGGGSKESKPKAEAKAPSKESTSDNKEPVPEKKEEPAVDYSEITLDPDTVSCASLNEMAKELGTEGILKVLEGQKIMLLKSIARDYKDFGLAGSELFKASKARLLEEFEKYYSSK